ncbi:MAG: ABC transporter substrate-binding protein/permease [Spirochaetia bacterium]|nr:ABC transporter substrate-binding protein/permease [Spirochaetia bacterium]
MKKSLLIITLLITTLAAPCLVFAGKAKNGITTIEELNGKAIGVQTGVLYEDVANSGISAKEALPDSSWLYYKMPNDMIAALQSNKIAAYLIEEVGFFAQKYEHPELVRLDKASGYCDFAVIVGNRDGKQQKLYAQLQEFIAAKKADGWLDSLYDYWVKNWNPNTCKINNIPATTGENGTVSIAIEGGYEPFSFESNGQFSGYDVEFMMNFCAAYGYKWDFKAMEFDAIAVGVLANKYDFGMNIVVDEERADASVLSDPYYRCDIVFVLEGDNNTNKSFFDKLCNSFYKTFKKDDRWKLFVSGIGTTMLITVLSAIFGTILGFIAYMSCRHGNRIALKTVGVLNWFFEGIPTVVFLMILSFVVFQSSSISSTWIAIIGFSFIFGSGMYDMLCIGCQAIPKGQTEASMALGYNDKQLFFKIILPQAAKHFLPIYSNDIVTLIKETSVVGYIAVMDLTKMGDLVRSRTYDAFFPLIFVAIMYFIMAGILTSIVRCVEKNIDPKRRSKEKILKGIVEQE